MALHRILREPVLADDDSPRFDCSAVDGYALRLGEAEQPLAVVAEIQAGTAEVGAIETGECARIFTGARVPRGADYVAMQEDVAVENRSIRIATVSAGTNIRQ